MTFHATGTRQTLFAQAALETADWLRYAAAPTFAVMALVTAVLGGNPQGMLCMAMQSRSPFNGMVCMYVLMSLFHAAPWLKLIFGWRNAAPSN